MIAALPADHATVFYADVDTLRKAGILNLLAGSKAVEEAEYRKFVQQTGFDYRTDLDSVAAAFVNGASYFIVRGRFQWKQLADYARLQGGECHYAICSLPGSSLERNISFYPLQPNVLALAVTPDPGGVNMISPGSVLKLGALPAEPIWISIPSSALAKPGALPEGVQALLDPVARAERVIMAVGPQGERAQLRLSVVCKSPEDAVMVKGELASATDVLRSASLADRPGADRPVPGQPDWAGFLRGGTFSQAGPEVMGAWPLERSFLEALVSPSAP